MGLRSRVFSIENSHTISCGYSPTGLTLITQLDLIGLLGAAVIGLALGLLGSGGSVLTVPVLVFLFGQDPKTAITGSLLVVGTIALVGALLHGRRQRPDVPVLLVFAPTGMIGSWLGATASAYVSGALQLQTLSIAMLIAAALMIRSSPAKSDVSPQPRERSLGAWLTLGLLGTATGLMTGFVGVGGGFLIVPALVIGASLPMHQAVATSLVLITLNAYTGFLEQWSFHRTGATELDFGTLALVTALGIVGLLGGEKLAGKLSQRRLRQFFGIVLIVLAAMLLWDSRQR